MKDDLAHIRNLADEQRRIILAQHQQTLNSLFDKHPDIKANYMQAERLKKQIISLTLAKLKGQALDGEIIELEQCLDNLRQDRLSLLKQHRISPDSLEPKWACRNCQDTGMVYINDRYQPCTCLAAKQITMMRRAVSLPTRLAEAAFDKANFELYQPQFRSQARKIFDYVKGFCDNLKAQPSKGLYVHGPTGSGKSYLMGCIANYLCPQMSVKYMVYADFLDLVRATYNSRETELSEQQMIDEVKNVDMLLLDDLGVEKPTEFSLKNLAQIIDYRYRNCLPLVVTSNFTLEELIQRSQTDLYGERIVWRLSECCSNMLELKGNLRLNL